MSIGQIPIICILFLGAYLLSDVTESKCVCTKIINDYCCESAHSPPGQKDACCHTKGFAVEPPKWQCDMDAECRTDRDCSDERTCTACKCDGPSWPPEVTTKFDEGGPPDFCPESSECSADNHCTAKPGETCKCASCECVCERNVGPCTDSSACRTDDDCKLNKNGTIIPGRQNFGCVDCACERTMTGDCLEGECRRDEDCEVGEGFKGFCDTSSCQCFLEEM